MMDVVVWEVLVAIMSQGGLSLRQPANVANLNRIHFFYTFFIPGPIYKIIK